MKNLKLSLLTLMSVISFGSLAQSFVSTTNTTSAGTCDGTALFDTTVLNINILTWNNQGIVIQYGGYSIDSLCSGTYSLTYIDTTNSVTTTTLTIGTSCVNFYAATIPIDSTLLDNPITKEELNDQPEYTMFVFDDVDGIEIRLRREVYRLLNVLINVYRSKKLNIIFSSHKSCDVSWTSTALQGCDVLVFFHRNYNRNVEYLVREYINKKEVKNFEKGLYNNSRYCCFIKTYPSLMLFEDQIKIC